MVLRGKMKITSCRWTRRFRQRLSEENLRGRGSRAAAALINCHKVESALEMARIIRSPMPRGCRDLGRCDPGRSDRRGCGSSKGGGRNWLWYLPGCRTSLNPRAMTGSLPMRLPDCQNALIEQLPQRICHSRIVLHGSSPVECPGWKGQEACGSATSAVRLWAAQRVRILYGDVNPAVTWQNAFPVKLEDSRLCGIPEGEGRCDGIPGAFSWSYRYYAAKRCRCCSRFGLWAELYHLCNFQPAHRTGRYQSHDVMTVSVNVTSLPTGQARKWCSCIAAAQRPRPTRYSVRCRNCVALKGGTPAGRDKTVTFTLRFQRLCILLRRKALGRERPARCIELAAGNSSDNLTWKKTVSSTENGRCLLEITENTTIGDILRIPGADGDHEICRGIWHGDSRIGLHGRKHQI